MPSASADQVEFHYPSQTDAAGLSARVAVVGSDAAIKAQIADDLRGAGLRAIDGGCLADLIDEPDSLPGDVVVIDCPTPANRQFDAKTLAGLARLDMRVAQSAIRLIVATDMGGLDDIFAVFDQSEPQILVSPSRAERIIAVGRTMSEIGTERVRDMGEDERLALLRISQQVEAIARSLDRLSYGQPLAGAPGRLADTRREYRGDDATEDTPGRGAVALPDPALIRQIIADRQARAKFFDAALFGDPAWDMLLDLTAAHGEGVQVSVTSLCIAAGVPATTALRWITQLVESGIFVRVADPADRRRAFIALSDKALAAMAGYFANLRTPLALAA